MPVRFELRGPVAIITLDRPPVNSLGLALRRELFNALEKADALDGASAIVLAGSHSIFSGGADITEFGRPEANAEPSLHTLIRRLESTGKPVVAAIRGVCMGGGLEMALACHYRVVATGTSIALPEVKIGLIPGAGGTQRLPRVLGVEAALNFIAGGEPVKAECLAAVPGQRLFDRVVEGDLLEGAISFASEVAGARPLPLVRNLPLSCPDADGFFQFARNTVRAKSRNFPAPAKCVDAVEAAVKSRSIEDGLAEESSIFVALMQTPEHRALRHAFLAERAANKIPGVPSDTPLRRVERVAIIGAGTMGAGIAMCFLSSGLPVTVLETKVEALQRGLATIRKTYEAQIQKGKLSSEQCEATMARLSTTLDYAEIGGADLVIEAVFEDLGAKEAVFRKLDEVMKPGAILATNTSTLDLNRIAAFTQRPRDVIGMHFFSPAHVMRLLELVRGDKTADDVLATVMALGRKIRKTCVVAGVCDGFIGNRMIEQYMRQAGFLLDEGCTPQQVDNAVEAFGFAMGPFRMSDLAGGDISWAIRKRRYIEKPGMRYSTLADRLCELGRFGQKAGAGWYDYLPGLRHAVPSPRVEQLLMDHRKASGIVPRRIDDAEIVHRLVFALVNEGAHLLEEGIGQRAGDIDVVYLTGYGFPAHRGGPMCYANETGLINVMQAMKRFAANPLDDAGFWQPAPLLAKLAAAGRTFG